MATNPARSRSSARGSDHADHPLKGIINTNDDPNACAICSTPLTRPGSRIDVCCGKEICHFCSSSRAAGAGAKRTRCPTCNAASLSAKKKIAQYQKKARKGQAWAQHGLGTIHYYGSSRVTRSTRDAIHWLDLASAKGNPYAMCVLGVILVAEGHADNLPRAQELFERAMMLSAVSTLVVNEHSRHCQIGLTDIANKYMELETPDANEKAKAILLPIAEKGLIGNAQALLGKLYLLREGDHTTALKYFLPAAFATDTYSGLCPAFGALCCCTELQRFAQAKFWMRLTKENLGDQRVDNGARLSRVRVLIDVQRRLRSLRNECGGCGIEFEGKERKFCRGCRAYCYCSRECQKMHWNRKEGGHREDCKGMLKLKQKMKERKRAEAIKASEST